MTTLAPLDTESGTENGSSSVPDDWNSVAAGTSLEASPPAATFEQMLSRRLRTEGWSEATRQMGELLLWLPQSLVSFRQELFPTAKVSAGSTATPTPGLGGALPQFLLRVEGLSQTAEAVERAQFPALDSLVNSRPIADTKPQQIPPVADRLVKRLVDQPIEDGVSHPAEQLLREGVRRQPQLLADWALRLIRDASRSTLSADLLGCIGRLESSDFTRWAKPLVEAGLGHPETEVRDAAVQVIEHWTTPELLALLREHTDPVPWLQEYIEVVLKEAGEA